MPTAADDVNKVSHPATRGLQVSEARVGPRVMSQLQS